MTGGDAWGILGIAPTTDARTIRAAYTQRLKEIDVERDPYAFVELREALEVAQRSGFGPVPTPAGEPFDAPEPVRTPGEVAASVEPDPAAALQTLLYGEYDGEPATPERREAMLRLWDAIIADPRMQDLGRYADIETWASETIARTVPLSDPLVVPAVLHFGWIERAEAINLTPAITYLVDRYHPMMFVEYVLRPDHPLHNAWCELTRPADADAKLRRGKVPLIQIHKLVSHVVRNYPELYGRFDPWRLSLWGVSLADLQLGDALERMNRRGSGLITRVFIFGWIAILALGALARSCQPADYRVETR